MSLIGTPDEARVAAAWQAAMEDVLKVVDLAKIPELNEYQCGTYQMHSLDEAHQIARDILAHGWVSIKTRNWRCHPINWLVCNYGTRKIRIGKQEVSRHNGSGQGAEMNQELQEWREETAEIIAELLEDGSDPDVEYPIEHHFAALDFDCLEKLAVDLYKAGF